jgi:hypothetical protein
MAIPHNLTATLHLMFVCGYRSSYCYGWRESGMVQWSSLAEKTIGGLWKHFNFGSEVCNVTQSALIFVSEGLY